MVITIVCEYPESILILRFKRRVITIVKIVQRDLGRSIYNNGKDIEKRTKNFFLINM